MLLHEKGSQERILLCKLTASHSSSARNNLSIFWNGQLRISQSPRHLKETVTFGLNSESKVKQAWRILSRGHYLFFQQFLLCTLFVFPSIQTKERRKSTEWFLSLKTLRWTIYFPWKSLQMLIFQLFSRVQIHVYIDSYKGNRNVIPTCHIVAL